MILSSSSKAREVGRGPSSELTNRKFRSVSRVASELYWADRDQPQAQRQDGGGRIQNLSPSQPRPGPWQNALAVGVRVYVRVDCLEYMEQEEESWSGACAIKSFQSHWGEMKINPALCGQQAKSSEGRNAGDCPCQRWATAA